MSDRPLGQLAASLYGSPINGGKLYTWDQIADAIIHEYEARQWKPIESAPKDGTWILTWVGGVAKPFPYICAWSDSYSIHGLGGNWNDGLCQMGIEVTHWTPIPAPPQEVE